MVALRVAECRVPARPDCIPTSRGCGGGEAPLQARGAPLNGRERERDVRLLRMLVAVGGRGGRRRCRRHRERDARLALEARCREPATRGRVRAPSCAAGAGCQQLSARAGGAQLKECGPRGPARRSAQRSRERARTRRASWARVRTRPLAHSRQALRWRGPVAGGALGRPLARGLPTAWSQPDDWHKNPVCACQPHMPAAGPCVVACNRLQSRCCGMGAQADDAAQLRALCAQRDVSTAADDASRCPVCVTFQV